MGPGTKTKLGFRFSSIFLVLCWIGSDVTEDPRLVWDLSFDFGGWSRSITLEVPEWSWNEIPSFFGPSYFVSAEKSCGEALGLRSIMLEGPERRWKWNSKLLRSPLSCPGWEALGQESFLFKKRPQILVSFCVGCCCSWSLLISSLWSWVCSIGLFELYFLVFFGCLRGWFLCEGWFVDPVDTFLLWSWCFPLCDCCWVFVADQVIYFVVTGANGLIFIFDLYVNCC